jgi:hypothetical protein
MGPAATDPMSHSEDELYSQRHLADATTELLRI